MKTETLNALLIDRSLGELTSEAAELLDAYLAEVPEAAACAAAYRATVATAHSAIEGPLNIPPVPALAPWHAPREGFVRQCRAELVRIAASLIIGISVGWAGFALKTGARSAPVRRIETQTDRPGPAIPGGVSSFWSVAGLSHSAAARPPVDRPVQRLQWESPMTVPQWEEKR
jgi:anti-sigma factor RsiW